VKEIFPTFCAVGGLLRPPALPILERYRDKLLTFNDDIQGTAAVASALWHGAAKVAGRRCRKQVVMLGAVGRIAFLNGQRNGGAVTVQQEASARIWVGDISGPSH